MSYTLINKRNISPLKNDIDEYPEGIVALVDKPYRWTSADVVRKFKFKLTKHFDKRKLKVGHAGTLDPLATGVLLVCIGKSTKIAELLQAEKKEYIAEIKFGATTPCFDLEKEVDATYPFEHINKEAIEKILPDFLGEQEQIPPIFSAKMINGIRAYEYARSGEPVEMRSAHINIYALEILKYEAPTLTLRIECSKGTYIRAIARDFGVSLNSGAHLTSLRRTKSGGFNVENAIKVEDLESLV
ncbi:MAG: tRNA pseudouridine(55) synthase TruB [Bacteroidales bacterium]